MHVYMHRMFFKKYEYKRLINIYVINTENKTSDF